MTPGHAAGAGPPRAGDGRGRVRGNGRSTGRRPTGLRIYARTRKTGTFYYGDFRAYADVGGRLEPLVAPGATRATEDFAEAAALFAAREQAYRAARTAQERAGAADMAGGGTAAPARRLGPFLQEHLVWKATRPEVRTGTLERDTKSARVLLRVLGNLPITAVTPQALETYVAARLAEPGTRRGSLTSPRSVRAELHTLSNAFRRAVQNDLVAKNPVARLLAKPAVPPGEAPYLTDAEAARLLAAAREEDAATATLLTARDGATERNVAVAGLAPSRTAPSEQTPFDPTRRAAVGAAARRRAWEARPADAPREPSPDDRLPFAHAVAATYLYTGGRASEVLGLLAQDVDFARDRVRFRHNAWRRLKREHHERSVQLWPALREALLAHVHATGVAGDDLLFPSPTTGGMLDRFGKPLDRCVRRAGITGKRITPKALRHTFATALLQTLVPVASGGWAVRNSFDVAKQLGHRSSKLVDDTYGHAVEDPVYRHQLHYGCITAGPGDESGAGGGTPSGSAA